MLMIELHGGLQIVILLYFISVDIICNTLITGTPKRRAGSGSKVIG